MARCSVLRRIASPIALALVLAAACGDDGGSVGGGPDAGTTDSGEDSPSSTSGSHDGSSGTSGSQGESGEPSDPDAPRILSFSTNVSQLTQEEMVTFSAVVTDPDGIDDLIGGSLFAESGAAFGSFASSAQEGAYSLTLSWAEINQVEAIEFTTDVTRSFEARFFDTAGHETSTSVEITLHCDGDSACDGVCVDLQTSSEHCGACGESIPEFMVCAGGDAQCPDAGEVVCGDGCVDLQTSYQHCGACDNDCEDLPDPTFAQRTCIVGQCGWIVDDEHSTEGGAEDLESCDSACTASGGSCATLDWSSPLLDEYPDGCGSAAGCFWHQTSDGGGIEDTCVQPLSCGDQVGTDPRCGVVWLRSCFCV